MTEQGKNVLTRFFIIMIIAIIVAVYYFSELRAFEYKGYTEDVNRIARLSAELNATIVRIQAGDLDSYDPIDKTIQEMNEVTSRLQQGLKHHPNATISENLKDLILTVKQKEEYCTQFKEINPALMTAVIQFTDILSGLIDSQAGSELVGSCLQQTYQYQFVNKIHDLFRGILTYINFGSPEKRKNLNELIQDIREAPQKYRKLDEALMYADKILELQPKIWEMDDKIFKTPIVIPLNRLNRTFNHAFQEHLSQSRTYRVVLYLLVIILLGVLRWAFSRLRRTVATLHVEVERKIKAEKELEQNNRQLEQRVAERTRALTAKNNDLNHALANLKEAQEQLIIQEKMASVGMLTTGIAHEIKNPLNFVNNFSDISVSLLSELEHHILAKKNQLDPDALKNIQELVSDLKINCTKIKEHGERADNIVKNMLLHSQEASSQKELLDVCNLMDDTLTIALESFLAPHGKIAIQVEKQFDPNTFKILASPQSVGRVFIYLIDNAVYALREKKMKNLENYQPILKITIAQLEKEVQIKVWDNGMGIAKPFLDKVFEPFFTTKPTGKGNTGLGLSICYDIVVKQHKGELKCTSEEGVYTEFTVTLPRA